MKKHVALRAAILVFLTFLVQPASFAQFSPESTVGVSAGFAKLFGNLTAFSAKVDVQMLDTNRQEALRTPMNFAFLDRKMRLDIDLNDMRGKAVQPAEIAGLKRVGMDRIGCVIRLDRRMNYLLFSGVRGYLTMEMSPTEAAAAEKNVQVQRTALGKETVDKHPCTKNKVVVKSAKGVTLLEAFTWNATDMKDFPVVIAAQSPQGTTYMRFTQVQMTRPAAAQFEPPAQYRKYGSPELLLFAAVQNAQPTKAAAKPAAAPKTGVKKSTGTATRK